MFIFNIIVLHLLLIQTKLFNVTAAPAILGNSTNIFKRHVNTCSKEMVCIDIWTCPEFLRVFKPNVIGPQPAVLNFVQRRICGLVNPSTPKACCSIIRTPPSTTTANYDETVRTTTVSDAQLSTKARPIEMINAKICGVSELAFRIIAGYKSSPGEFPWMALLGYETEDGTAEFRCGGTLIHPQYVLTAAHCVHNVSILGVRLGEHNIYKENDCGSLGCQPPVQDIALEKIIEHPLYDSWTHINDIALIKLQQPAKITRRSVSTICLPTAQNEQVDTRRSCTISGWGVTEAGDRSPVLLQTNVRVVPNDVCQRIYRDHKPITPHQICAGGHAGRDSCAGDSGGPMMQLTTDNRYTQVGIISYGPRHCGMDGFPGVYTRVNSYINWITSNMV